MTLEPYLPYLEVLPAFSATPPDTRKLSIISDSLRQGARRSLATGAADIAADVLQMTVTARPTSHGLAQEARQ